MIHTLIGPVAEHPELVAGLVTGLIAAGQHYLRTGRVPIGRLPYRAIREVLRELGDQYGARPRPSGVPGLVVRADLEHLERQLREADYESVDLYSYEYAGEVLNFRRPSGVSDHPETGTPTPTEVHVRVFDTDTEGELWCIAHEEASRFEAYGAHMREAMLDWGAGRDALETDLGTVGIESERRRNERLAGLSVIE